MVAEATCIGRTLGRVVEGRKSNGLIICTKIGRLISPATGPSSMDKCGRAGSLIASLRLGLGTDWVGPWPSGVTASWWMIPPSREP